MMMMRKRFDLLPRRRRNLCENPDKLLNDQVRTGTRALSNSKQTSILGFVFVRLRIGGEENINLPFHDDPAKKNRHKIARHFHWLGSCSGKQYLHVRRRLYIFITVDNQRALRRSDG